MDARRPANRAAPAVKGTDPDRPSPVARPLVWINRGAVALAVGYLALLTRYYSSDRDFFVYYHAAEAIRTGTSPYQAPAYRVAEATLSYATYGPLFAWLLQPLAALGPARAHVVWFLCQCAALVGLVWLCIRESGSRLAHRWWGVVLFCTLTAQPAHQDLLLGQAGSFIAFLVVASFAASRRSGALGGFLLALAASVKFYPGLIWMGYLRERQWPVVAWSVVSAVALLVLSVLTCGLDTHFELFRKLASGAGYPLLAEHNDSVVALWCRMFTANPYVDPLADAPWLAVALIASSTLGVLGAALWLTQANGDHASRVRNFNLWVGAMLLLYPATGLYNLMLLLMPALGVLRHLERGHHRGILATLVVATALLYLPPMSTLVTIYRLASPWMAPSFAPPVFAVILMFGLSAVQAYQCRKGCVAL